MKPKKLKKKIDQLEKRLREGSDRLAVLKRKLQQAETAKSLKAARKSLRTATTTSLSVRSERLTSRCSTTVSTIGVSGKSLVRYLCTNRAAGAPMLSTMSGKAP